MEKRTAGHLTIILLLLVLFLAVFILKSYLIAILAAVVLTIIFHPLYETLCKRIGKRISASLTTLVALIFVLAPSLVLFQILFVEVKKISNNLPIADVIEKVQPVIESWGYAIDLESSVEMGLAYFSSQLQQVASSIPAIALATFVTFYLLYFMLQESQPFIKRTLELLPLSAKNKDYLSMRFHDVTYGVVYGQILTAIVQGLVAMIGFFIAGLDAPVFLGLLTMFFAFIPVMGTGFVWVPASLILYAEGAVPEAIFILIWGSLVVGLVDNFLRPILIGRKAKLHPAFVLLGVVGGISAFGIMGLFIGPLLLVFVRQVIYMLVLGRAYGSDLEKSEMHLFEKKYRLKNESGRKNPGKASKASSTPKTKRASGKGRTSSKK